MAGVGYLLMMGTAVAEYVLLPKLVVDGDAAQTSANIVAHPAMFNGALMLLLTNFAGDVLAAWGLYILLEPVHASLSLLAAWLRLVYTAIAGAALLNLVSVRQLLLSKRYPANLALLGADALHVQVRLSIDAWETQFGVQLATLRAVSRPARGTALQSRVRSRVAWCDHRRQWARVDREPLLYVLRAGRGRGTSHVDVLR